MRAIPFLVVAVSFLMAVAIPPPAQATPVSTDTSDLWFNANESGWGASVFQQGDTMFLVLYVYGGDNQPRWFVASSMPITNVDANGVPTFSGPLYLTSGNFYGSPFNPATVGLRQVGTATFTLTNLTTATLVYSVDGVQVTKNITRQFWKYNDMSGSYLGGQAGTYSGCTAPGVNGYQEEPGTYTINHATTSATLTFAAASYTCTFSGAYAQAGKMGQMTGNFTCTNGVSGNFQAFALETQITGLLGRLTYTSTRCSYSGRIGGLRRGS